MYRCVSVWIHLWVQLLQNSEDLPEVGGTVGCEPSDVGAGNWMPVLCKRNIYSNSYDIFPAPVPAFSRTLFWIWLALKWSFASPMRLWLINRVFLCQMKIHATQLITSLFHIYPPCELLYEGLFHKNGKECSSAWDVVVITAFFIIVCSDSMVMGAP